MVLGLMLLSCMSMWKFLECLKVTNLSNTDIAAQRSCRAIGLWIQLEWMTSKATQLISICRHKQRSWHKVSTRRNLDACMIRIFHDQSTSGTKKKIYWLTLHLTSICLAVLRKTPTSRKWKRKHAIQKYLNTKNRNRHSVAKKREEIKHHSIM